MKQRPQLTERSKQTLVNLSISFLILIALITLWAGCTDPTSAPIQEDCIELDTTTFYLGIRGDTAFPGQTFRLGEIEFNGQSATHNGKQPKYWRLIFNGEETWLYCITENPERTTTTFYGIYSPDSICGWARHVSGTSTTIERSTAYRVQ